MEEQENKAKEVSSRATFLPARAQKAKGAKKPSGLLDEARQRVAQMATAELVAHHALLNRLDPIEAARRYAIFQAVEEHTRAWVAAGQPPLPDDATTESIETLRRKTAVLISQRSTLGDAETMRAREEIAGGRLTVSAALAATL